MPGSQSRKGSTFLKLPRRLAAFFLNLSFSLHPSVFAFVMATGIVSNALFLEDYRRLSAVLFRLNAVAYPWLAILLILRALRFPGAVWSDLVDTRRAFSFFTLIAANGVFGGGLNLRGVHKEALELWLLSLPVWTVLLYFSFGLFTIRNRARLADINEGGWLFAIVATESLAILGALVAPSTGSFNGAVSILVHLLWELGAALYGIYVTLLSYRLFYGEVTPGNLTPVLWVVMGAAAISTNAGSTLLLTISPMPSLAALRPFIEGVTLILWVWAAFWIPLLVLFGIWKHAVRRVPLSYSPILWGIVFPLGMFAVASLRLSLAEDYPPLHALSAAAMWVSLAAWIATFLGLANATRRDFWKFMRGRAR